MTTVRVTGADYRMNAVEAVYGWLAHDNVVVPHDTLYPDGKTEEQSSQENAEEFSQSQESAKVAALGELGIPVVSRVVVGTVVKGAPAEGRLHAGDVIKAVDGVPITDQSGVAAQVTKRKPGQKVEFTIVPAKEAAAAEKAGKEPTATRKVVITTTTSEEGDRAVVGIQAGTDHVFPFTIDIKLADVGGPSAGLMFALGIVDKLTPDSLTGGRFVAGTGTIDDKGEVGPIGGIEMKLVGARNAGAEYFLTPADNCAAAASDTPTDSPSSRWTPSTTPPSPWRSSARATRRPCRAARRAESTRKRGGRPGRAPSSSRTYGSSALEGGRERLGEPRHQVRAGQDLGRRVLLAQPDRRLARPARSTATVIRTSWRSGWPATHVASCFSLSPCGTWASADGGSMSRSTVMAQPATASGQAIVPRNSSSGFPRGSLSCSIGV